MIKRIFITLVITAIAYWFLFDFIRWIQYDNQSYSNTARLLFAIDGGSNDMGRITKPLFIFFPGLLEKIWNIYPQYTIIVQNFIFFFLNGCLFYKIIFEISGNKMQAYLGMLAFITCQPYAVYSLLLMADGAGWFWELLTVYFTIYILKNNKSYIYFIFLAIIMVMGMLTKESVLAAIVFCVFSVFLHDIPFCLLRNKTSRKIITISQNIFPSIKRNFVRKKIFPLTIMLCSFIILFIAFQIGIYFKYNFSIIDVIRKSRYERSFTYYYNLKNIRQVYRILDLYWIFFTFTLVLWFKKKIMLFNQENWLITSLLTLLIVLILLPIGWPYIIDRVLFMVAPFAIIISSYGIIYFKEKAFLLVSIAGVFNVIIQFIIYKYKVEYLLYVVAGAYLLFIMFFLKLRFKSLRVMS